jgi:EAL and modified HD-GYP domain-containing signal transduction protein
VTQTVPPDRSATPDAAIPAPPPALVARQGIYNAAREVLAYELLYRRTESATAAELLDGTQATLQVIVNSVLEIGLDRLSGALPVHVNYPTELLVSGLLLPIPAQRVVIEVVNGVRGESAVLQGLALMRERGHRIALDDFSPQLTDPTLLDCADTVKLDAGQFAGEDSAEVVAGLKGRGLRLIAQRVETGAQFDRCLALGFDAFQGYFLQHPQTFSAQPIASSRLRTLRLIAVLQSDDSSISDIEALISEDVSLSYRLLRCINSSYFGFDKKIESMRQAIMILGFEKLRQLSALIALRQIEDRPQSVFLDAVTRARMCEKLGTLRSVRHPAALFITGLFSTLDALTGIPMRELLQELPLTDAVARALTSQEGEFGAVLREAIAFERGAWNASAFRGLTPAVVQATYLEAVSWAEATQAMVSS